MGDVKSVILVLVIILLIGAAAFLTYMISNGGDPLVLFNTRATSQDEMSEDFLADSGDPANGIISDEPSPIPTYASTSPASTPSASVSPVNNDDSTATVTPISEVLVATPTPQAQLPTAGA